MAAIFSLKINKMKIIKKFILVLMTMLTYSTLLYGANSEKPISLQIANLSRWKNSPEASAIRQSLGAIHKQRRNYPRVTEPFKGASKYTTIFRKPLLLLDSEPNHFGGFFALAVFKNYPKVFRLWIYEIDKNVFEVREVIPLRVNLGKMIMNELEDKRIVPFWQYGSQNKE
jgi:hypothetical protein